MTRVEKNEIVELVSSLRSFANYFPKHKALTFIELPSGTIKSLKLRLGQKLSWSAQSVNSR